MSVKCSIIRCTRCTFSSSTSVVWGRFKYELPSGLALPLNRTLGWCESCNTVVAIEDLDPSSIEKRLAAKSGDPSLRNHQAELVKISKSFMGRIGFRRGQIKELKRSIEYQMDEIEELTAILSFLSSRKSGPRCLQCGSQKVQKISVPEAENEPLNIRNTDFIHPHCGGLLTINPADDIRLSVTFGEAKIYSPEGIKLRRIDGP